MHKRGRIIEIRGFRGLFMAIFIVCCLVTGFTVFPGFVAMKCWNLLVPYVTDMPQMHLLHGIMLWAIVFLIWFAFNGHLPSLHFGCNPAMDDDEIRDFIDAIKKEKEQQQHIEMSNDENSNDKGDLE